MGAATTSSRGWQDPTGSAADRAGTNTAYGGDGNDFIEAGGDHPQTAYGEEGNDVLSAEARPSTVPLFGGDGDDTLYAAQAHDPTPTPALCGLGLDTVLLDLADAPDESCEVFRYEINGTDGDDVITGTPYDDTVLPFTGRDVVRGFDVVDPDCERVNPVDP